MHHGVSDPRVAGANRITDFDDLITILVQIVQLGMMWRGDPAGDQILDAHVTPSVPV